MSKRKTASSFKQSARKKERYSNENEYSSDPFAYTSLAYSSAIENQNHEQIPEKSYSNLPS